MTTPEFKKVARLLKEAYKELEKEALDSGMDIFGEQFKTMQDALRLKVLANAGFTLEEYRAIKDSLAKEGVRAVIANEVMPAIQETKDLIAEQAKTIPTQEDILQLAHEVAKTYVVPPVITNQIVKETIVEKPTIVKETKVEHVTNTVNVPFDEKPLQEQLNAISKKVDEIKVPEPVDLEKLVADMKGHMNESFEKNINTLGMPNFRKLAMGLQGQIDDIRRTGGAPAGSNTYLQYNDSGAFGADSNLTWNKTTKKLTFGGLSYILDDGVSHVMQIVAPSSDGGIEITGGQTAGDVTLSAYNIDLESKVGLVIHDLQTVQILGDGTNVEISTPLFDVLATNSTFSGNVGIGSSTSLPLRGVFDINQYISIGNVTSGTLTLSYNDPGATGDSGNGDPYYADGLTYGGIIYAYKTGSSNVYSATGLKVTPRTANSSNDPMELTFSWSAVTGASGYIVLILDPQYLGSTYSSAIDVGNTTSLILGDASRQQDNAGGVPTLNPSVGPNFYIDGTTGAAIHKGTLDIQTGGTISGTDVGVRVYNSAGAANIRYEGTSYAKMEFISNLPPGSSATANSGKWQIYTRNDGQNSPFWHMGALNDAEDNESMVWNVYRSGQTVGNIEWGGTHFGVSGKTSPTAKLHLPAGSTAANTAPLKIDSGSLMTTPEAGAIEFLTNLHYFTRTTGPTRLAVLATQIGRSTAQTAAVTSVVTYTPPADGSFIVTANVLVTTATAHNFTVTCAYTDEGNTARTVTMPFSVLAGTFVTAITNIGGAVPYEGIPIHIRAKASTAITIATTGTFTTVTYNVEGSITQIA